MDKLSRFSMEAVTQVRDLIEENLLKYCVPVSNIVSSIFIDLARIQIKFACAASTA